MTSTSSGRLWDLAAYLARRGFVPHSINSIWLDHSTGQG
jgi:hypothetical protein